MTIQRLPAAALAFLALASSSSAAITGTFVPAIDAGAPNGAVQNSFLSSDGTSAFSTTTATSGFWHNRTGTFDIVGMTYPLSGAFQGQNKTGPTVTTFNELVTKLTLSPNTMYDIYIIHGVNTAANAGNQPINAGFTSGSLTTFLEADSTPTGLALQAASGTWQANESFVGTATADGSGNLNVFVSATLNGERSIYNGLSFVQVPEPSSAALLGLAGLALISRRRR